MEDFVTYELAVKLKEKGFDWETREVYERNIFACRYEEYSKPTTTQVLKWLREEKDIYISVFIDDDSDYPVTYEIYKNTEYVRTQGEYFTLGDWNKCELKAIEYVLDNLI